MLHPVMVEFYLVKDVEVEDGTDGTFRIRIVQDVENGTLSFAQEQYIEETLHQFRMSDCKGVKTPFYTIQVLSKVIMPRSDDEIKKMHAVPYRVAVGCLALTVYSDADWGNDRDDRRYISGCCAPLWCSDCMTINKATHETAWLRTLKSELEKETSKLTLLCDNSGSISISTGQSSSVRTRHIDIRHHFVKEKIQEGKIEMS
ncbi:Retrovirus-related Pol polyprotein from transposon TNT 1-94 [Trichinella pseudospiralis]|uniref:Retrovirus-related Pol polyprotein from transposon TNT 1-94 n=2 Tax=Trichinella pseudospiralis TaxID=6337 RepID=A0A0V1GQT1_TRIPS|nr:Retrovirus-related Pol polyprotein from transposon TNT 1-94 [Trichinella pseudospiralis]